MKKYRYFLELRNQLKKQLEGNERIHLTAKYRYFLELRADHLFMLFKIK